MSTKVEELKQTLMSISEAILTKEEERKNINRDIATLIQQRKEAALEKDNGFDFVVTIQREEALITERKGLNAIIGKLNKLLHESYKENKTYLHGQTHIKDFNEALEYIELPKEQPAETPEEAAGSEDEMSDDEFFKQKEGESDAAEQVGETIE